MSGRHEATSQKKASRKNAGANGKKKKRTARGSRLGRVVDRSTETVERFHRAVASWPLDALVRVRRLEAPVARVRKLQERSITTTYEFVRGVNREVAQLVRETSRETRSRRGARRVERAKTKSRAQPEVVAEAS